jgi:hypothetical protein
VPTFKTPAFVYFAARVRIAVNVFYCMKIVYRQINARIWIDHRKIGEKKVKVVLLLSRVGWWFM